jgi:dTDP-glucose 4,6-dehydratase
MVTDLMLEIGIYKVCFSQDKNQIWNISANNCLSNNEVVKQVSSWVGKDANVKFVENRLGQDMRYSISSKKIRLELGWRPEKETLFNFL